jgi:putative heme iron utilization protein
MTCAACFSFARDATRWYDPGMQLEEKRLVKDLLTKRRVLALSVLVDGAPYTGLLPFVVRPDFGAALVHASRLARHTRGLVDDAPFSALIHQPDPPGCDPLQLPRITLQGRIHCLDKSSPDCEAAQHVYLARLPQSAQTFDLPDFNLYALIFDSARYVVGFGQVGSLTAQALRELATEQI